MADFTGSSNGGLSLLLRINRTSQQADREYYKIELWLNKYSATWDSDGATWSIAATSAQTRSGHYTVSTGSTRVKLGEYTSYWLRNYGSSRKITVTGSSGDIAYKSIASVTGSFTVAARPYNTPAAPSGVSAVRVSDTQVKVQVTASASTAAPVSSVIVQRSTDGAGYVQVASLSGAGGKTWTDTGVAAGHYYRYRVYATGGGGSSPVVYSSYVYMTPLAPSGVSAVKNSSQDVVVSWANTARGEYQTRIYEGSASLGTVGKGTTSFTVVSPSATVAHTYSVAHTAGGLESVRVSSNQVQLAAAPYAPTNLAPNGQYAAAGQSLQLSWRHNPADSSAQSKAELSYTTNMSSPQWQSLTTITGDSDVYVWNNPGASPRTLWWRVRTWGQDPSKPSPWSSTARIDLVTPPSVTISQPATDATIATSMTLVSFTAGGNAQYWKGEVETGGQVVQSGSGALTGGAGSWQLTGLENKKTYRVRVAAANRVWGAYSTRTFTVAYAAPIPPLIDTSVIYEQAAVNITITDPEPDATEVMPVSYRLERSTDNDAWETIGENLPAGDTIDPTPPLAEHVYYRVVGIAASGTEATSTTVDVPVSGSVPEGVYLNWGAGMGENSGLFYNIDFDVKLEKEYVKDYFFAGHTRPSVVMGGQDRRSVTISASVYGLSSTETLGMVEALRDVALTKSLVMVRAPGQPVITGYVASFSLPRSEKNEYTVSMTVMEAD